MNSTKVSVIIVNYNGQELLEKCLDSLFKVNYDNFEVILVDNNSIDKSIEFVRTNYPSVIIIKLDSNKGFAEPNNIAVKVAKGEFILFLNNDTIVTPDFIRELLSVFTDSSNIAICQSLLLKLDGKIDSSGDFIDPIGVVYNSTKTVNNVREISSARGASMMIRKKIFSDLGGFDEKFFVSFEDVDLGWRTWINGYKVVINPKSVVYHYGGKSHNAIKNEIAFHGFKNQLAMKITNFETKYRFYKMLQFLIVIGFRELKILFDYQFTGKTLMTSTKYVDSIAPKPSIKTIIRAFFWIASNTKYISEKSQQIKKSRKVSTKELEKMGVLSDTKQ